MTGPPIRQISSRIAYENAWMRVRHDEIELADGSRGIYGVIEKPDFSVVIPREEDGSLWLVDQYRYPADARSIEFPQGGAGDREPDEVARIELKEETGMTARSWRSLGGLYSGNGLSDGRFHCFLATGLEPGEPSREASEQDMTLRRVSEAEFAEMIRRGEITDGPTVAAWGLFGLGA